MENSLTGEKNIYYNQAGRVSFDLSSFVSHRSLDMDPEALYDFLLFGAVLPPHTILKNINSLFPGESLSPNSPVANSLFKDLGALEPLDEPLDYFVNELDRILGSYFNFLRSRGQKLCLFLSGGVDSGILASYLRPDDYCITWAGWGAKTTDYARAKDTVKLFHLKNHLAVLPDYEQDEELFSGLAGRHYELFKFSGIAYYKMASRIKDLIGSDALCITGDNADTIAGSFGEVVYAYHLSKINKFTKFFPWRLVYNRYRKLFLLSTDNPVAISAWLHSGGLFPNPALALPANYFTKLQTRLTEQIGHPISRFNDYIFMGMLLTGVVRQMSGLRSIIARELNLEFSLPFCSEEIVNLFLSVPDDLRRADHYGKVILKRLALKRGLPQSFISQPKKGMSYGHREYFAAQRHLAVWQAMEGNALLNKFVNIPIARQKLETNFPAFDTLRSLHYYFKGHQDFYL